MVNDKFLLSIATKEEIENSVMTLMFGTCHMTIVQTIQMIVLMHIIGALNGLAFPLMSKNWHLPEDKEISKFQKK